MFTPVTNLHKKGEHVFNDIAGSVENAYQAALGVDRASSLILTGQFGPLQLSDLGSTSAGIQQLNQDTILAEARTIVSRATGAINDRNSQLYSQAKKNFEEHLSDIVVRLASWMWKKRPHSKSSFLEFEAVVAGLRDYRLSALGAKSAMGLLIDAAHDPDAEAAALAEKVSDTELKRRRTILNDMHRHCTSLKESGSTLVDTFVRELEVVLERRVGRF